MRNLVPLGGTAAILLLAACSMMESGPSPEDIAQTYVAQTAAAASPTPLPSDTPEPTSTFTPVPPTPTPTDTATPRPTATIGPVVFRDDFDRAMGNWVGCEHCTWNDGGLMVGPYPVEGAYLTHNALCRPCGLVRNYRMAVDVTYGEGPSTRGFGLLVRLTDHSMVTAEVTPWQTAALWLLSEGQNWDLLSGLFTGWVKPGRITNRIEVVVSSAPAPGKSTMSLNVNGRTVTLAYDQPSEPGAVGLSLYGHATQAIFDNFEFQEMPPFEWQPLLDSGPVGPTGLILAPGS